MGEAVLFLCTANICRSPMAQALLKAKLARGWPDLAILSAGFMSEGHPAHKNSVWALRNLGIEMPNHVSTNVSTALAPEPDLILVMARQHLRMLAELKASSLERAFTLKGFVRLAAIEGTRNDGEYLAGYVRRVAAGREVGAVTSPDRRDDIADPMGQRKGAFSRCASELNDLTEQLSLCLCPSDT